ncbi:MAG: hypothetical protein QG597_869 [Actinomycetota bacterium]|jgi:transcriptional regulator with XRE-family HTH domain|nr:hypothetical protein [Actinomycetota bacterium]
MPYEPTAVARAGREVFGRRLRELREGKDWTQERLALAAGLDRSFLVDVEGGHHSLMLDRVFDVAAALDVSADELLRSGQEAASPKAHGGQTGV